MKKMIAIFALSGMAACGGTSINMDVDGGLPKGGGIVATSGGSANAIPSTSNQDQSFGKVLNNVRIGNGSRAVTYNSRLDAAAQAHADDMVARGYFAHESPEGDDVEVRIKAQGYTPVAWGENLAGGQRNEAAALAAWENSKAHDRMMNANSLEEFGLGVAGSGNGTRWVLVMATEG